MKKLLFFAITAIAEILVASDLAILPWSMDLNCSKRFEQNSSGAMTIRYDEQEKAIRFDVKFSPGTDFGAIHASDCNHMNLLRMQMRFVSNSGLNRKMLIPDTNVHM